MLKNMKQFIFITNCLDHGEYRYRRKLGLENYFTKKVNLYAKIPVAATS